MSQVVTQVLLLHQSTQPPSNEELPDAVALLLSALSGRMQDPQVGRGQLGMGGHRARCRTEEEGGISRGGMAPDPIHVAGTASRGIDGF